MIRARAVTVCLLGTLILPVGGASSAGPEASTGTKKKVLVELFTSHG